MFGRRRTTEAKRLTEAQTLEAESRASAYRSVESLARKAMAEYEDSEGDWRSISKVGASGQLTDGELAEVRSAAERAWLHDAVIGQAANLTERGSIGGGLPTPRAEDPAAQEVVDEWWADADNKASLTGSQAQAKLGLGWMLAGERFYTLHTAPGDSAVRTGVIPPEQIRVLITAPENGERVIAYGRKYKPRTYDATKQKWVEGREKTVFYRAWDAPELGCTEQRDTAIENALASLNLEPDVVMYHTSCNTTGLRGVPEVFRALHWSMAHNTVLSSLFSVVKALGTLAWKLGVDTTKASDLADVANEFKSPTPGDGGVHVSNSRVSLDAVDAPTGQPKNQELAARAAFLMVIMSFGFGEHYYGDASTGNLAIGTSMEVPAIMALEYRQSQYAEVYSDLAGFAILRAIATGRLPRGTSLVVHVKFPAVKRSDAAAQAALLQALATGVASGLVDDRIAAELAYLLFGVEDIAEILERQFDGEDDGEERTDADDAADQFAAVDDAEEDGS